MHETDTEDRAAHIAIVGMSGRFPGASGLETFWQNLRNGVESVTLFSEQELAAAGVDPEALKDPAYVPACGALSGVDLFDAGFFELTPREAEIMDPQLRLLLECAWEALEDAGCDPSRQDRPCGLFAGSGTNAYLFRILAHRRLRESAGRFQIEIGNEKDHLATQVAYRLDLRGPALTLQTGCSTSLVAVHLAVQSLLAFECDLALAGGVSITLPQPHGYLYQEGGVLSPDGHCRAFDARAGGTVSGSGAGLVALKRLDDALAAGDTIRAVIRGSAINNDGSQKVGYTAPSVSGQAEAIRQALAMARLEARDISYVEAHGTATPLGDPIEMAALHKAFAPTAGAPGSCALGSVKTNLGHLNTAAGVAGLIKTVEMLRHAELVPSLHFETPNPEIDFASGPFQVNTTLRVWETDGSPRRAGVSSFSIGGTNAHVVLEEAPASPLPAEEPGPQLLVLSARTPSALERMAANLAEALRRPAGTHPLDLADVAYTLQAGRKPFPHRRALVCRGVEDAVQALEGGAPERSVAGLRAAGHRPVAFLFPGQGAQAAGMGAELYRGQPVFRREVDRCAEILRPLLGADLRRLLVPAAREEEIHLLGETEWTQPALFVCEYALARLWMAWGVRPAALLGHSVGEYVAACLAGVFPLEQALALVAARGRLLQATAPGAMLAVALSEAEVLPLLGQGLSLAAVNGPAACVVAGSPDAVAALEERLAPRDIASRRLPVNRAFHSSLVEPAAAALVAQAEKVALTPPDIPWVSNVTGTWIAPEEALDPRYWGRQLRATVRFADGLATLFADPDLALLEAGPGESLGKLARRHAASGTGRAIVSSLAGGQAGEPESLLLAVGRLWLAGVEIDWTALHPRARRRVPLPTYPFERRRYWVDPEALRDEPVAEAASEAPAGFFYRPAWQSAPRPPEWRPQGEGGAGSWLVFAGSGGLARAAVERLRALGHEVFTVDPGDGFSRAGSAFTVHPGRRDDYDAMLKALARERAMPSRVLHLWTAASDPGDHDWQDLGFCSLLALAQAIGNRDLAASVHLGVVSSGLQKVAGELLSCPEKATLLGPCKVLPKEYPGLTCQSFDVLPPPAGSREEERLAGCLLAETAAGPGGPDVAYRGLSRWVRTFVPAELAAGAAPPLRRRGVYLITGGLDGIGFELARELARRAEARLVLAGRAPRLDEAERQALEDAGAELLVFPATDVADRAALAEIVLRVRERFGAIHGVIQAEEIPGSGLIQFKDPRAARTALAVKTEGTRALQELLGGAGDLDFWVLSSSSFAQTGGVGLVEACAASSFVDAFAEHEAERGEIRLLSLGWGLWRSVASGEPEEAPELRSHLEKAREESGFTLAEGADLCLQALAGTAPHLIVSRRDFQAIVSQQSTLTAWSLLHGLEEGGEAGVGHDRPEIAAAYAPPGNELEQSIAGIFQELFGIERIGVHDNFFELGGHSLLAVQLVSRLRSRLQLDLPLSAVFEAPTVAGLAARVAEMRLDALEDASEIEDLLREIQGMSEEELRQAIAREAGGAAGERAHG